MNEIERFVDQLEIDNDFKNVIWFIKKHNLQVESRHKEVKTLRQYVMYLIKKSNKYKTYSSIGKMFKKDHATVMHSCRVIENLLETKNKYLKELIDLHETEINSINFKIDE